MVNRFSGARATGHRVVSVLCLILPMVNVLAQTSAVTSSSGVSQRAAPIVGVETSNPHPKAGALAASPLDFIKLLALGPIDGTAVLLMQDKRMITLRIGETIPGTRAVLAQVLPDKVILDEPRSATLGQQIVWMHKSEGNGVGKIERFSSFVPPTFAQYPPKEVVIASSQDDSDAAISSHPRKLKKP